MTLVDVRSPGEFAKGHIPGAHNLPLFSDQERAAVGTTYKQVSPTEAYLLGLEIVAAKAQQLVDEAHTLDGPLEIYCWRGGMRSQATAKFLQLSGLAVSRMEGGYKAYRRQVRATFSQKLDLRVLGGATGSGKTTLLQELAERGEQVLDLEGLANHKGSSFGMIGQPPQPSQEMFENLIAEKMTAQPLWIEDESRMIGTCQIPDPLFHQMQAAPIYLVQRRQEERIAHLVREYGTLPKEELIAATLRLRKRLGGQRTKEVLAAIERGDLKAAIEKVLPYYDKSYRHCLKQRGARA